MAHAGHAKQTPPSAGKKKNKAKKNMAANHVAELQPVSCPVVRSSTASSSNTSNVNSVSDSVLGPKTRCDAVSVGLPSTGASNSNSVVDHAADTLNQDTSLHNARPVSVNETSGAGRSVQSAACAALDGAVTGAECSAASIRVTDSKCDGVKASVGNQGIVTASITNHTASAGSSVIVNHVLSAGSSVNTNRVSSAGCSVNTNLVSSAGSLNMNHTSAGSCDPVAVNATTSDASSEKTKAQLKAERRAIQEAQRAAKAAGQNQKAQNTAGQNQKAAGQKAGAKGADVVRLPEMAQVRTSSQHSLPETGAAAVSKKLVTTAPATPNKKTEQLAAVKEAKVRVPDNVLADNDRTVKRLARRLDRQGIPQRTAVQKRVVLFTHLHQYEHEVSLTRDIKFKLDGSAIHPAILRLGLQYAEGVVCGSNARCIALLAAMKQVIADYETPPQRELSRDLDARIKPCISFLTQCRPLSVSMGNAIKYLKHHITHIPSDYTDEQAKATLTECIDQFYKERIQLAAEAISMTFACHKIYDNDVILVYSCSSLILRVLCDAHDQGKKFRVIVADGRPKLEGQEMLRRLVRHGIKCSYVLISSVSYVMREVTKVLLGAHALLANGYVMSRVGSSQVALIARAHNVPVLVCCETYKFCERAHTDSFVFNELGDPDDLVAVGSQRRGPLSEWRDLASLYVLNLMYDVTPPELLTMVITELGMIPCTSVPVVLRVKCTDTE